MNEERPEDDAREGQDNEEAIADPSNPQRQPVDTVDCGEEGKCGGVAGGTVQDRPTTDAIRELLLESIGDLDRRIDLHFSQTAAGIAGLGDQLSFLPKQIRNISAKIDDVSTAIAESNYRSLLLSVVSIYDLSEQMLRTQAGGDPSEERRCLATLTLQLRQILESNGLVRILTEGRFDPKMHRAIESFACADPGENDMIKEEIRPGFLDGSKVLRFAEVTVWKFAGSSDGPAAEELDGKQPDPDECG